MRFSVACHVHLVEGGNLSCPDGERQGVMPFGLPPATASGIWVGIVGIVLKVMLSALRMLVTLKGHGGWQDQPGAQT